MRILPVCAGRAGRRNRRRDYCGITVPVRAALACLVLGQAGRFCFDLEVQSTEGRVRSRGVKVPKAFRPMDIAGAHACNSHSTPARVYVRGLESRGIDHEHLSQKHGKPLARLWAFMSHRHVLIWGFICLLGSSACALVECVLRPYFALLS